MAKSPVYSANIRRIPERIIRGGRGVGLTGAVQMMKELNRQIRKTKGLSQKGLVEVSIHIRNETEDVTPKTPVDIGNLRASWFSVAPEGLVSDPKGFSGNFKNRLFKKMQYKASQLKAEHNAIIAECQQKAVAYGNPNLYMGFSANYAMWVHEMVERFGDVDWSREGSGGKWFEAAIKRNRKTILQIVRDNAYIT